LFHYIKPVQKYICYRGIFYIAVKQQILNIVCCTKQNTLHGMILNNILILSISHNMAAMLKMVLYKVFWEYFVFHFLDQEYYRAHCVLTKSRTKHFLIMLALQHQNLLPLNHMKLIILNNIKTIFLKN